MNITQVYTKEMTTSRLLGHREKKHEAIYFSCRVTKAISGKISRDCEVYFGSFMTFVRLNCNQNNFLAGKACGGHLDDGGDLFYKKLVAQRQRKKASDDALNASPFNRSIMFQES